MMMYGDKKTFSSPFIGFGGMVCAVDKPADSLGNALMYYFWNRYFCPKSFFIIISLNS